MKKNTQKLLLFLYGLDKNQGISSEKLDFLYPELSERGKVSLLYYLESKHLLSLESAMGRGVVLSSHGEKAVEGLFPAFNARARSERGWEVLIFQQAPKSDPNFRYLRSKLTEIQAIPITRGVYLYPGTYPDLVQQELARSYIGNVVVLSIEKWLFGDERQFVISFFQLFDLLKAYSGISKEVNTLIAQKELNKELNDQQKVHFAATYDRFFHIVQSDRGLITRYFSQAETGPLVLSLFQRLILL